MVLAVGRTSWQPGIVLVSLVAWAMADRKRIHALVPVTDEQGAAIISLSDWTGMKRDLRTVAEQLSDDVLLVRLDEHEREVIGEVSVPATDIRMDLFGDVESALSPERRRWAELV
jgi:hypothetical protein